MNRVLSFHPSSNRSYGEPSEFVTKKLCLSFLFSIGLLCLLAGFLLGGKAADWSQHIRQQHMIDELAENGMHATKHMQLALLDMLNATQYFEDFEEDAKVKKLRGESVSTIRDIFADLDVFKLNVDETKTGTVATICGTEEPDRYIVFSASGEGFDVAIKIARTLNSINAQKKWHPKRTLIFCVFIGSMDPCEKKFIDRIKPKIAAYIAVHGNAAKGNDEMVVAGSGMVQATILDSIEQIKLYHRNRFAGRHIPDALPRLNLDIPHAVLSYVDSNSTSINTTQNQKILAQIVGLTMWRLSEETFFRWDPKYFSGIMNKTLDKIKSLHGLQESKDDLNETVTQLIENVNNLNKGLDNIDVLKSRQVRIMNDQLLDIDRALLCPGSNSRSKTDLKRFEMFPYWNINLALANLNEISDCYKEANNIFHDQAVCRRIVKNSQVP